jgi:hypothetical protein
VKLGCDLAVWDYIPKVNIYKFHDGLSTRGRSCPLSKRLKAQFENTFDTSGCLKLESTFTRILEF